MQLGIFARSFPGTTPLAVMAAAKAAGFDAVHYNFSCSGLPALPERVDAATCAAIVDAARQTGIGIAGLSGTYNMAHPDPLVRHDGARRLRAVIAAAARIGAPIVTLCSGTRDARDQWRAHPDNASDAAWTDMIAAMRDALAEAETQGVDLGVEPELANIVVDAAAAERLLAELRSPRLKIVLDPANLFETASDGTRRAVIADAIRRLGPHIAMAHAKDRAPDGGFVAAGSGVVDFAELVARLRAEGFDGPLVAHGCTADEAAGVARHLRAAGV
ncbi:sugar phosphate isomerase/epimerase family protein [Paracoccus lutimaris]|uniref:Sugar phosphate isomerase/epimerase n=1 Tax=Paracoccus lutimaris TaxID=1490030 RepID=A0A368YJY2_9RHOB|nr:sugar phosphate isomerase/epimerase [Paracoccus lutimaris]RCW80485.1 sugar phosphate isomerase/epimerase [Paracoccus lutimaris]